MKLRQLECFTAVMASGTMTAAARQIGTSQPGVSNLIAKLEHEVGFDLFRRRKGRLVPTPEALHFYRVAERIVSDMEDARQTAVQISEGRHGQLTIATLPGLGLTVVPTAINRLRKDKPDTRFRILTRSTDAVRLMIPSEQCDVAIVEAPVDAYSGHVELFRFECVAVLPKGHRLSEHEVISPELWSSEPVIALFPDHGTTLQLQRSFFSAQVAWRPVVEARFFSTCCELVSQGLGVSIVDPMTARRHAADVIIRKFEPQIIFEVAVTLPGDGPHSRLATDFISMFRMLVEPFVLKNWKK